MIQPNSDALFARAQQLLPGGVNSPVRAFRSVGGTPFFTQSAHGATLTTADGQDLVDFVCTWGPAIHGHHHPTIREAIASALDKGTSFGTPNAYEIEMAERIAAMVPSIEKVRMTNSGTEAAMSALRLARGATGRDKVVKFAGCYHGHVDGLLVAAGSGALTHGQPDSAGVPRATAQDTLVLPFNDPEAVNDVFARYGPEIAAVMVEPYPANCGLIPPVPGFLENLRTQCTGHGALLIFDEVMTGFRISAGGVQAMEGVMPDLTALGKIIGGGLPVGAIGGPAAIMDQLAPEGPVYQAGTLSGNPLAMAAGIASLDLLKSENPYARLDEMGQQIAHAASSAAAKKGIPLQVPQRGSMFCLFFSDAPVADLAGARRSDTAMFAKVFHACLDRGVYLPPSAYETCFISTAHSGEAITRACEVLDEAILQL